MKRTCFSTLSMYVSATLQVIIWTSAVGLISEVLTAHSLNELGGSCKFSVPLKIRLIYSHRQSRRDDWVTDEVFMVLNGCLSFKVWRTGILLRRLLQETFSYIC